MSWSFFTCSNLFKSSKLVYLFCKACKRNFKEVVRTSIWAPESNHNWFHHWEEKQSSKLDSQPLWGSKQERHIRQTLEEIYQCYYLWVMWNKQLSNYHFFKPERILKWYYVRWLIDVWSKSVWSRPTFDWLWLSLD